jgi:iron(III) transport system permease protein
MNSIIKFFKNLTIAKFIQIIILLFFAIIVFYPNIKLVISSFEYNNTFSLMNFHWVFENEANMEALLNSITVATIATIGATFIGIVLAWLVSRTDIYYKNLLRTSLIIPYLIPPFIGGIAWIYLLGPVGLINSLWMDITGSFEPLFSVYGAKGIILVMILYGYPIPFMSTVGPFKKMNAALEEAAQISGAGTWKTFKDITFPIMLPSILGSFLLLYMSLLANFGIPAIIGFPAKYFVLTTRIYQTILNFDMTANLQAAAALSILLVLIAVIMLCFQRYLLREGSYTVVSGKSTQVNLVKLGKLRGIITALIFLFLFIVAVLPVLAIIMTALTKAYGIPFNFSNMTFRNFTRIFNVSSITRSIKNSLFLGTGSSMIIVIMASIISYMIVKLKIKGSNFIEITASIPYAIPGTVVALAMILAWSQKIPVLNIRLYNTIWVIMIAYIARFLILAIRPISSSLYQIDNSLEEIARISGANSTQSFRDVIWPLTRSSVFASFLLVFTPAICELTLSALLWSVGNETIGVMVFNLHEEGKVLMTAAFAVIIIIGVLIFNVLSNIVSKGKYSL